MQPIQDRFPLGRGYPGWRGAERRPGNSPPPPAPAFVPLIFKVRGPALASRSRGELMKTNNMLHPITLRHCWLPSPPPGWTGNYQHLHGGDSGLGVRGKKSARVMGLR